MGIVASIPVYIANYLLDIWDPIRIPSAISAAKIVSGLAGQELGECLEQRGYCLIHPNQETIDVLLKAKEDVTVFFDSPDEGKKAFIAPPNTDPLLMGKRENRGYMLESTNEYLKIRMPDASSRYPQTPQSLESSFRASMNHLLKIGLSVCQSIAKLPIRNSNKTWIDPNSLGILERFLPIGSSFSVMRYWIADDHDVREHEPVDEHVDTNVLTLIRIGETPGLRIYDQLYGRWVELEKMAQKNDLVLLIGSKIHIFGDHSMPLTPIKHKVIIPKNKERYSILFCLDVPTA